MTLCVIPISRINFLPWACPSVTKDVDTQSLILAMFVLHSSTASLPPGLNGRDDSRFLLMSFVRLFAPYPFRHYMEEAKTYLRGSCYFEQREAS